jgi:hypothetical protein
LKLNKSFKGFLILLTHKFNRFINYQLRETRLCIYSDLDVFFNVCAPSLDARTHTLFLHTHLTEREGFGVGGLPAGLLYNYYDATDRLSRPATRGINNDKDSSLTRPRFRA